jgi:hypothetical protein
MDKPAVTSIHVYTYGYCSNNAKRGSRGAIGVFVRDTEIHDPANRSMVTSLYEKQSSGVASLLAVEKVVDAATNPKHALHGYFHTNHMRVVVHVDTRDTTEFCTGKGAQLEKEGFPVRSSIDAIRRVYAKVKPLRAAGVLRIVATDTTRYRTDYDGTALARRLAKNAVMRALTTNEKKLFYLNSTYGVGCMYDDGPRFDLDVPHHEYAYARSKGAWWDAEVKTFFLYENDVGCHYDMRRVDYVNLRNLYG